MVDGKDFEIPAKYDVNAKWDACIDLGVRRFVYSSFAGGFAGLFFFRECFLLPTNFKALRCLFCNQQCNISYFVDLSSIILILGFE